jgi:lysozyme
MYELSPKGEGMLKGFEALRLTLYYDACGLPTIGWGHRVLNPQIVYSRINEAQAETYLTEDLTNVLTELNQLQGMIPLNQQQVDALVIFVYDIGVGAWRGSTARKCVLAGKLFLVPREMIRWVHDFHGNVVPGLVPRQGKTASLFATGAYA